MFLSYLSTVDSSSLHRCAHGEISQQDLLELLVENLESKHRFQDKSGAFLPHAQWSGVIPNDSGDATRIQWNYALREDGVEDCGNVAFRYLPETLRSIDIRSNRLHGTLEFADLPGTLEHMFIGTNAFSGSADLAKLPPTLVQCRCEQNAFSGTIDLTRLPGLIELFLHENSFEGTLDLTQLPIELGELTLSDNCFSGTIDLSELPYGMQCLSMANNWLTGPIDLSSLPGDAERYEFGHNNLSGNIELPALPPRLCLLSLEGNAFEAVATARGADLDNLCIDLRESGVQRLVDENGHELYAESVLL